MNERPIGGEPSATWMRYVTDLESKLQAAEAEALLTHMQLSSLMDRAEAAEAKNDELVRKMVGYESGKLGTENVMLRGRLQAAGAEVARLTGCLETANSNHEHFEREWYLRGDRIEELEQSIGLLTTLAPTMEMDSSNPMSMARTIETVVRTRIAELEQEAARLTARVIPESGGHLESTDCWCGPTVEEHPGGTLIIHNQTH